MTRPGRKSQSLWAGDRLVNVWDQAITPALAQFNRQTLGGAPALGEHSYEVLSRLLNLDGAELNDLVVNGVVQTAQQINAYSKQADPLANAGYANT